MGASSSGSRQHPQLPAVIEIRHRTSGEVLHRVAAATLDGACLRGLDLAGADLSFQNLHGVDLSGANLEDATLLAAYASGTILVQANLCGADLRSVDLSTADLNGACYDDRTQWARGFDVTTSGARAAGPSPGQQWQPPKLRRASLAD